MSRIAAFDLDGGMADAKVLTKFYSYMVEKSVVCTSRANQMRG